MDGLPKCSHSPWSQHPDMFRSQSFSSLDLLGFLIINNRTIRQSDIRYWNDFTLSVGAHPEVVKIGSMIDTSSVFITSVALDKTFTHPT